MPLGGYPFDGVSRLVWVYPSPRVLDVVACSSAGSTRNRYGVLDAKEVQQAIVIFLWSTREVRVTSCALGIITSLSLRLSIDIKALPVEAHTFVGVHKCGVRARDSGEK